MSRVPRPAASNSSLRAQYRASPTSPASPTKSKALSPGTPTRLRVPSLTSPAKPRPVSPSKHVEEKEEPPKERLSLKEQIALKRAEAKKAQTAQRTTIGDDASNLLDEEVNQIPGISIKGEEEIADMGRWGVRESVERARSTGQWVNIGFLVRQRSNVFKVTSTSRRVLCHAFHLACLRCISV